MKNKHLSIGVGLIMVAALFSATSQVFWKVGVGDSNFAFLLYVTGFLISGIGMLIMMVAFRFGDVSILQPMMTIGYVFSIPLGLIFFQEPLTLPKLVGTMLIVAGTIYLGVSDYIKVNTYVD